MRSARSVFGSTSIGFPVRSSTNRWPRGTSRCCSTTASRGCRSPTTGSLRSTPERHRPIWAISTIQNSDQMLKDLPGDASPEVYGEKTREMSKLVLTEVPMIPLRQGAVELVMSKALNGYTYWFHGLPDARDLSAPDRFAAISCSHSVGRYITHSSEAMTRKSEIWRFILRRLLGTLPLLLGVGIYLHPRARAARRSRGLLRHRSDGDAGGDCPGSNRARPRPAATRTTRPLFQGHIGRRSRPFAGDGATCQQRSA